MSDSWESSIQILIEEGLKSFICQQKGGIPLLEEAVSYALLNGGRRIRPKLTLLVAQSLPYQEAALPSALAMECFHSASLVADDLPCMDNEPLRRNLPSTHMIWGEGGALLVTYALIAHGFTLIGESGKRFPIDSERGERLQSAVFLAGKSTGVHGATGGQFLDLFSKPEGEKALLDLLERKTAALFGMAFGMGWIFGGGDLKRLPELEQAALHFGKAFQLMDDLDDEEKDRAQGKKSNLSLSLGKKYALLKLEEERKLCLEILSKLRLNELACYLEERMALSVFKGV